MSLSWQDARYLAVIVLLAGCSSGANDPVVTQPKTTEEARPAAPATAVADAAVEKPAAVPATPAIDPGKLQEARTAFAALTAPGSDPAAWEAAQQKLISLGSEAAPVLLEGIKSENAIEREMAATVCALTGSPNGELQAALLTCLKDEAPFVRANAAVALAGIAEHQDQAIAALTDMLSDADPQLRRMAAANLGSFGEEASEQLPKLTAVLANDDDEVVTPVIQLLGRMGPTAVEAVPQLQRIAFEEQGPVKQAAEQALLQIQVKDKPEN